MLIECKKVTEPLRLEHASQLYRYFSVTNARVAILTNGQVLTCPEQRLDPGWSFGVCGRPNCWAPWVGSRWG
jgi:hypothetical protein